MGCTIRCRMKGISVRGLDATMFRRGFAAALAGITDPDDPRWEDLINLSKHVPDDALATFYVIARAAIDGKPCPDDMDLARHDDEQLRSALAVVRHRLLGNAELACAELGFSSGVIVAVKRRS